MSTLPKPRFHDEECFGSSMSNEQTSRVEFSNDAHGLKLQSPSTLIVSARNHLSEKNLKAAVDDIITAYESLADAKADLAALRNKALRELSTNRGWQSAPDPQALRLRRLTPSIPLRSHETESTL